MKVLAKVNGRNFICEVSDDEIKKFLNTYYATNKKLEVGDVVDLAKGYNFASDVRDSLRKTQGFIKSNGKIVKAIIDGVKVFGVIDGENHENNG